MKNFSIYGNLVDRYLFNFRMDSDVLESHLPKVSWLKPRIINGYGVVSFCLLKLKGLTVWPLPTTLGLNTTSCAYRCAVTDESGKKPEPSVYVLGRNTDLSIISRLGPALFSGNIKKIEASIKSDCECVNVDAKYSDGKDMFSATVNTSGHVNRSKLFDSVDSFEQFIKFRRFKLYGLQQMPANIPGLIWKRIPMSMNPSVQKSTPAALMMNG